MLIVDSKQLDRLSNIFDNAGQVILGVSVLSPLIEKRADGVNMFVVASGIIGMIVCWVASIMLSKRRRK